jgi:hypothetical protein
MDNNASFPFPSPASHLQSRVNLVNSIRLSEDTPVIASLRNSRRNVVALDISWSLNNIDIQTSAHVPCNVAMERPDTWVISLELDDDVGWDWWASCWESCLLEDLGITTSWVLGVGDDAVPGSGAFC